MDRMGPRAFLSGTTRADSDDVWNANKLRQQVAALRARPECRWSFTSWSSIDAAGRPMPAIPVPDYARISGQASGPLLDRLAKLSISVALPSVLVERALLVEAGLFEESLTSYEDYDLWVRLAALAGAA